MYCRSCNRSFDPAAGVCPNCGWTPSGRRTDVGPPGEPRSGGGLPPLPSPLPMPDATEPEGASGAPARSREAAAAEAPAPGPEAPARREPAPQTRSGERERALAAPDPGGLRTLLAERPELLEPGLEVVRDERGAPAGAGYATGVGDIDLLARDARGSWVVVLVAEPGSGEELVAGVLQRIGWVRKHLGDGAERVRGVVLVEEPPASLSYAAAAVSDTVAFKTWRIALTFSDLEV